MSKKTTNVETGQPIRVQMSYGIGQIAGQIFRDVPSLLLLFFMTNVLGISAAIAGTAIFAPKLIVGALSDIIVGAYIDKWREKVPLYWWLLFGVITAPITMILLFNVPQISGAGQITYIIAIVSLYMLVFASFSVPYLAIAAAISNSSHQRTVLMAWRLVFTAIGVMIAGGLAPAFVGSLGGGASAYSQMSIILGAICAFTLLVAFFGVKKTLSDVSAADNQKEIGEDFNIGEVLKAIRAPRFSVLLFVNILQLSGSGMSYAAMLYFLTYTMALDNALQIIGLLVGMITLGIILGQPMWVYLSKKFGKKNIYVVATVLHAIMLMVWMITAQRFGVTGAIVFAFFVGVGNSGWVMLGFSMVMDIADEGRAGLFSSLWIAADKIGFALGGTFITGLILSGFGFDSQKAVAGLEQSTQAVMGVTVAFGFGPSILYFIAAFVFYIWGNDGSSVTKIPQK